MEKARVYYTDFRAKLGEGLPTKLKRLMKKAGISEIDMENKFVAIKMHFERWGISVISVRIMPRRLQMS